jgi:hypothetical protein
MGRGKVRKGLRSNDPSGSALLVSLVASILTCTIHLACAQGLPNQGGGGLAASGEDAAQRLQQEKAGKNTYRVDPANGSGGVESEQKVLENMRELFEKIYLPPEQAMNPKSELDEWFSPHLRDMDISSSDRYQEVLNPMTGRAFAGSPTGYSWWGCTGACPGCLWGGTPSSFCCYANTSKYAAMIQDTNFKACCVLQAEQMMSMEDIACLHQQGDGWTGLFEYYFPTTAVGWESQRGTTMIAPKDRVKRCMDDSESMMDNSDWVASAIQKGADVQDNGITAKIADSIQGIRENEKDPSLRFADNLQGGGLTMRVNFAHMDPNERRALATQFCMHEDQFMKLMDPQYDTKQIEGGPDLKDLQKLPIWANYCPEAVKLMTNPNETFKVVNTDGTKTNFPQGMAAYQSDPLYCQKMNARANPIGDHEGFLREGVLSKQGLGFYTEAGVGYTCRVGDTQKGGFSTRMVPVEMYSTAKIDPRTLDHVIPFLHAGGYYMEKMSNGIQSMYKRFEPLPYSRQMQLFTGKRWKGEGTNEKFMPCRSYEGKDYEGKDQPDQLYISNKNHSPFTQKPVQEFNRYDREWADQQPENFHNRNFDKSVLNYAAAFRIFATCPAGYVRWRGPGSEKFQQACGEENFGGITPPGMGF